jgi:hypothetical protein
MPRFLPSSRYSNSFVNDGTTSIPTAVKKDPVGTTYFAYTAKEVDTFESLASRFLGDSFRWWEIADINPHVPFPWAVPKGTRIRIPN